MYTKAAILALVAPLASATINIQQPSDVHSDSQVTFKWSSTDPMDPQVFSFELVNQIFHNSYAIANSVMTAQGSITIVIPTVPEGDGYTLEAVNITNINDVYAQTGQFSIGAPTSTSASGSAGASSSGSSVAVTTRPNMASSSAFGTTVGASATTVSAGGSTGSSSSSQTSSGASSTATGFNSAMSQYSTSITTMALTAFAGIVLLAL